MRTAAMTLQGGMLVVLAPRLAMHILSGAECLEQRGGPQVVSCTRRHMETWLERGSFDGNVIWKFGTSQADIWDKVHQLRSCCGAEELAAGGGARLLGTAEFLKQVHTFKNPAA